ncbi:MAG TPA: hypothetical protein VKX96_12225 [Chloroflexota bacterium]|nr:hypothetical protein [Chloroflexota bacterium]
MTLSDLLPYLRARKGGVFYSEVSEGTGIPPLRLVRAERTFTVPNLTAEELDRLAAYFDVPVDQLRQAATESRSILTTYLATREKDGRPAHLNLVGGVHVSGMVAWRDRHAVGLRQPDDTCLVVYRSNVEGWQRVEGEAAAGDQQQE